MIPVTTGEKPEVVVPDDATYLDTIEVTATKRLKSQREIPGSVGALKGEYLEKIGAQDMRDYLKLIPGVQLSDIGAFADNRIPIIRGVTATVGFSNAQLPTLDRGREQLVGAPAGGRFNGTQAGARR